MWRVNRTEAASAESGFSLLEILVALAIFALASMIAYSGLVSVASTKSALDKEIRFWRELGLVFDRMEADFLQSVPRPLPGAPEVLLPPLYGANADSNGENSGFFIELIRQDENRAQVRVRYLCEHGSLTLRTSTVSLFDMVSKDNTEWAVDTPLLQTVEHCEVAFLGTANTWLENWPGDQALARPRAIRIRLALTKHDSFERMFPIP